MGRTTGKKERTEKQETRIRELYMLADSNYMRWLSLGFFSTFQDYGSCFISSRRYAQSLDIVPIIRGGAGGCGGTIPTPYGPPFGMGGTSPTCAND